MRIGPIQKKFLILLFGHLSMGFCYSYGQRAKVLREMDKEWERVNEESLRQAIQGLYKNRLIDIKESADGKVVIKLQDQGREKVLSYKLDEMEIPKAKRWDGKWRMVLFDIPDNKKKARESLRLHLKRLGFYQYQKSVFIYPCECKNEIDFLVEFHKIRPYVRQLIISEMDNDFHLRKIFQKLIA
ncbi:MAG: CRISPR-associated endonuclease Cas2 [Candidatus Harrisonbacteria bacterium]|nr:CRISPR-associated endonuclease Cas2 [Candidatus Harrisonbacteria bacterium]